jgi:hypothetical protein
MEHSLDDRIRDPIAASLDEADRIVAAAEERGRTLARRGPEADRSTLEDRLARMQELRLALVSGRSRMDTAYARLAETMAAVSERLALATREADFSPPPWPEGLGRTVEVKLSETREVTFRYGGDSSGFERPREAAYHRRPEAPR